MLQKLHDSFALLTHENISWIVKSDLEKVHILQTLKYNTTKNKNKKKNNQNRGKKLTEKEKSKDSSTCEVLQKHWGEVKKVRSEMI